MMRLGIFGGTFNPPHIGHISAASAFLKEAKLDKLIIVPAYIPPHKDTDSSVTCEERLQMCKLAFRDMPNTTVSDIEILRGGKSYTYLTLQELSSNDTKLCFLCGTDMILSMGEWKNPELIFSLAEIYYIRRESDIDKEIQIKNKCDEYSDKYNASVFSIEVDAIEISSSEIRNNFEAHSRYLRGSVADYIRKAGLYR